ncbi:hypothetical protein GCM10022376_12740 [Yimella lutea]
MRLEGTFVVVHRDSRRPTRIDEAVTETAGPGEEVDRESIAAVRGQPGTEFVEVATVIVGSEFDASTTLQRNTVEPRGHFCGGKDAHACLSRVLGGGRCGGSGEPSGRVFNGRL